jgi:hypothetical protein
LGTIRRFNLARLIKEYKAPNFFETGTFRGDGVEYALQFPFCQFTSVEIIPELADEAKERFSIKNNVKIIKADSVTALADELPAVKTNCVFWLDAHFPGADAGITAYDSENVEEVRLPLAKELETICALRKKFRDVIIVDDLRIYEDGPYKNGNVPEDALPKISRNISFIYKYFDRTHIVLKCYLDEGYVLLLPKTAYKKRHFKFNDLFKTTSSVEDFYLV